MSDINEPLAERCNLEPNVFRGCTSSEIKFIVIFSAVGWLPIGILAWLAIGSFPAGATTYVVGILLTMFIAPSIFQRIKRGRPDGFYQVWSTIFLAKIKMFRNLGWFQHDYIMKSGQWDLGRTEKVE